MMVAGEKTCETNSPLWTISRDWIPSLLEVHPDWQLGFYPYAQGGRVMEYKAAAAGSVSVLTISGRTKHPEICVRLLEKLHTDQRYYDLLAYGIAGEHYIKVGEDIHFEGIPAANRLAGWTASTDGYMARNVVELNPSIWTTEIYEPLLESFAQCTQAAQLHPLNHLSIDASAVSDESRRLSDAWNAYMMPLLCGLGNDIDSELDLAIEKLREAGLDAYLKELQNQLTTFAQSREDG